MARRQVPRGWTTSPVAGVTIEQRVVPLERVGCYVPGGRYPLPSSLLMTAIPAQRRRRAGDRRGLPEAGSDGDGRGARSGRDAAAAPRRRARDRRARLRHRERFRASTRSSGPATRTSRPPRRSSSADCAIDFFAGPSEILVVSTNGRPAWIAADLIAQAEHDEDARAICVTPSARLARAVADEIARQMPLDGPARAAIEQNGAIVVTRSLDEAVALSQRMAPEHVVCDSRVGRRATHARGHGVRRPPERPGVRRLHHRIEPRAADERRRPRRAAGSSAADFVRVTTVQTLSRTGLQAVAPHAIALADAEGLRGHAASIRIRGVH